MGKVRNLSERGKPGPVRPKLARLPDRGVRHPPPPLTRDRVCPVTRRRKGRAPLLRHAPQFIRATLAHHTRHGPKVAAHLDDAPRTVILPAARAIARRPDGTRTPAVARATDHGIREAGALYAPHELYRSAARAALRAALERLPDEEHVKAIRAPVAPPRRHGDDDARRDHERGKVARRVRIGAPCEERAGDHAATCGEYAPVRCVRYHSAIVAPSSAETPPTARA